MRKRTGWKIWYDDGTTFSSGQGSWEKAPADGILIIMEFFADGKKQVHMGSDYYAMHRDTIMGISLAHLDRHLRKDPAWKFGRWTDHETWEWAHERAFGVRP